ncbi:MAG: hypothetical protein E3K40_03845 [Candidatus Brocadia sp.]|nr:hypothetical protein [Candidatus Brocadia sp.]MDG6025844.1 hypothetical protein [Candidatus Brocadia sp.]
MIERDNKIVMEMGLIKYMGERLLLIVTRGKRVFNWVNEIMIISKEKKGTGRQKFTPHREDEANANLSIIGPEPSIPLSEIYGRIESL